MFYPLNMELTFINTFLLLLMLCTNYLTTVIKILLIQHYDKF